MGLVAQGHFNKKNMEGAFWMSGESVPHIAYCINQCIFLCPQSASID